MAHIHMLMGPIQAMEGTQDTQLDSQVLIHVLMDTQLEEVLMEECTVLMVIQGISVAILTVLMATATFHSVSTILLRR